MPNPSGAAVVSSPPRSSRTGAWRAASNREKEKAAAKRRSHLNEGFGELLQRLARCHEENCVEKEELRRQVSHLSGEVLLLRSALTREMVKCETNCTSGGPEDVQGAEGAANSNGMQAKQLLLEHGAGDRDADAISETSESMLFKVLDPTERWGVLTSNLLYGTGGSCFNKDQGHEPYELLMQWSLLSESRDPNVSFGLVSLQAAKHQTPRQSEFIIMATGGWLQKLVVAPTSWQRLLWCMMGVILLTWDALIIPMQVFQLGDFGEAVRLIAMFTSAYWLVDMPFQCFIAFQHPDGTEEYRPWWILRNYVRTWFILDLGVLLIDAALFSVDQIFQDQDDGEGSFLQAGRSLRLARLVRLLRLVRLMRLRKLNELIAVAVLRIKSEHMILGIKLSKHVGRILVVNHYIACAWYALAYFNQGRSWLDEYATQDSSTIHVYIMALHWSMTQFSPATNNIAPQNWFERIFAVCVVLFALISFSSFISSVTNTVNQLRTLNLEPQMEEVKIREFLFARKVSPDLVGRILNFFKQNYRGRQKRIHEQDIPFFQDVPESMKIRLHEEAYMPVLSASPMFNTFIDLGRSLLVQVCHTAFSELFYLPQQDVFVDGTPSSGVYFINSGRLYYHSVATLEIEPVEVGEESWVAEMCLWVRWDHCGQLCAETSCEITKLDKAQFNAIVARAGGPFVECLRRFAVFVLGHIETLSPPVTDLSLGADCLLALGARARRLWELQSKRNGGGKGAGSHTLFQKKANFIPPS